MVHQHLDGTLSITHGPHLSGALHGGGRSGPLQMRATGCEKDAGWKSQKPTFPPRLEIPQTARDSHFPQPLRLVTIMKPDISCANKTGPFNLPRTGGIPDSEGPINAQLGLR